MGTGPKKFAWSFSKLKNYETCPKKFYSVDVAKEYKETSDQLAWGNTVHSALANACTGVASLPITMKEYQHWVDMVRFGGGRLLVEQKYAINAAFEPVEWFSNNAWYRGVVDAVRIVEPVAIAWDWKTGKILEDSVQLALEAAVLFAHFPALRKIRTEYVWLKDDCRTGEMWTREDIAGMWAGVLPRVATLKSATETETFPPRPSGLCRSYCPVQSCPYHGKGARG